MRLSTALALLMTPVGIAGTSLPVSAAEVTFSGMISYQGAYSGDSLYVAVLDTSGVEDVTLLDLQVFAMAPPPFSQPYSLTFDNVGVSPELFIASFLDVDGGGLDDVGGADVFGYYPGSKDPVGISPATSQGGLDFDLPRAEIRGTVTLAPAQVEARVDVSGDDACVMEGFRPGTFVLASGAYAVIGIYPGTYCVSAEGQVMTTPYRICYGDPTCTSPTLVTLGETEVATGIDLDFTKVTPVVSRSWGAVKARYR